MLIEKHPEGVTDGMLEILTNNAIDIGKKIKNMLEIYCHRIFLETECHRSRLEKSKNVSDKILAASGKEADKQ